MPDVDLLDLLAADHQNLASALSDSVVAAVMEHLTVERELLYPIIETYGDNGTAIVENLKHAGRKLEERLATLESDPSTDHLTEARAAIQQHIDSQEALFPQLRQEIPAGELQDVADKVRLSIAGSLTHPHPHLPATGLVGEIAEGVVGIADRVEDRLHGDDRG